MKCKDCSYKDASTVADPYQIKCTITGELHDDEDTCNCDTMRRMHDKRSRLTEEYKFIKDQVSLNSTCIICGKTVDNEYGATKVCMMCKEAVKFISANLDSLALIVSEHEQPAEEEC